MKVEVNMNVKSLMICKYNEKTGHDPSINDCDDCYKKFIFPHEYCCLEECGEHFFCKGCTKGI